MHNHRQEENLNVRSFEGHQPTIGERVYIDPMACVIGAVTLGDDISIWPGAVVRGDVNSIHIGAETNVQDNATLHVTHDGVYTPGGLALHIGSQVTIGHAAVLHACTIEDQVLIGMGSIILDGAVIEAGCLIGAGAVVSPGTRIPAGQLWLGNPARVVRELRSSELEMLRYSAENYVRLKDQFLVQPS